ncbi:PAS domain S-box-containing protein [Noviherbaspirillum humi]|uniref:histidine kinase n=1 Tax=Noviherbaspirillum humi TaxID=1688639 RepID=A0A239L447_9BURK|nr:ATP-binding protein [Noviherbaspirillum humi]SNT25377.1 PAS domain S-box-containing protein [Noviherbaspirillum humi]
MRFIIPAQGSLARRFAVAAASLATIALLLTAVASWWLVSRQHLEAERALLQRQADFHAAAVATNLRGIANRVAEVAGSSILATGLVDSAGRETYLAPYLNGIRQVNAVPIQILFTDFEGTAIADNGAARFTAPELAWLRRQLDNGQPAVTVLGGEQGMQLLGVEMLGYSRTRSPEGALLYKVALHDLQPAPETRLSWRGAPAAGVSGASAAVPAPPAFQPLGFAVSEIQRALPLQSLAPQYAAILLVALALAAGVLLLGVRLSFNLTDDLQRLDAFARRVVQSGFSAERAMPGGSNEVSSLALAINHMLDRLHEQHAQLLAEQEKLRLLANTIPQLAWIADSEGRIHWVNQRWHEYTGTTLEEVKENGWQRLVPPDVLPRVQAQIAHSLHTGTPFQTRFPLRGADGEYRSFFASSAPLRDADGRIVQWFGTNTDVSPLENAERSARESEERLREGMVAARMAVWDWNLDTDAIAFSANAVEIFGTSWNHAPAGMRLVHADDVKPLQEAIEQARTGSGQFHCTVRMIRPDNHQQIWVEVRGKAVCDAEGRVRAMRGISLDISERRRAEEELRIADRRKDEFLAMLAHELRNPLAPISTAAQLLKLTQMDQQRLRHTSDIIARQVQHMTELLDDLLDVSRVTRGLVTLDRKPLNVADVVKDALEQVRPLMEARRHVLQVGLPSEPAQVEGDATRLVQVIANVLNNAAKYTPEAGRLRLQLTATPERVNVAVSDNGIGIAPELLPHVFELFTQAERSPDRSQGGLGLGLALVKSLVELHGGGITARSDGPGAGSEFLITLPRLAATQEQALAATPPDAPVLPPPMPGMRLMVVDDNVDAAQSLAMLLEAAGHEVETHYDAGSALAAARARPPQVFMLDIGLPDMDGYELAKRLRATSQTASATLIALTGYGQSQDRDRSRHAGFDHHLVKPADTRRLLALLATIAGQDTGHGSVALQ